MVRHARSRPQLDTAFVAAENSAFVDFKNVKATSGITVKEFTAIFATLRSFYVQLFSFLDRNNIGF